jgi:hypothetical protein
MITVLWHVTLCSMVDECRCFGGSCCLDTDSWLVLVLPTVYIRNIMNLKLRISRNCSLILDSLLVLFLRVSCIMWNKTKDGCACLSACFTSDATWWISIKLILGIYNTKTWGKFKFGVHWSSSLVYTPTGLHTQHIEIELRNYEDQWFMWCDVYRLFEERAISIFRVETSANFDPQWGHSIFQFT